METADLSTIESYVTIVSGFYSVIVPILISVASVTIGLRVFKKLARAN